MGTYEGKIPSDIPSWSLGESPVLIEKGCT